MKGLFRFVRERKRRKGRRPASVRLRLSADKPVRQDSWQSVGRLAGWPISGVERPHARLIYLSYTACPQPTRGPCTRHVRGALLAGGLHRPRSQSLRSFERFGLEQFYNKHSVFRTQNEQRRERGDARRSAMKTRQRPEGHRCLLVLQATEASIGYTCVAASTWLMLRCCNSLPVQSSRLGKLTFSRATSTCVNFGELDQDLHLPIRPVLPISQSLLQF
jgi:hypothetical protein